MAETAKILNPERIVVVPDMKAGCSLADGCPVDRFRRGRPSHPGAVTISYINCSAEVKAESDYICTSSNAKKIVDAIPKDKQILFAPDRNLGRYLVKETGRDMVLWPGSLHRPRDVQPAEARSTLKERNPDAKIIAHPECEEALLEHADFIGSTSALLKFVQTDSAQARSSSSTESGILHQMKQAAPDKTLIPAPPEANCACNECPFMRLNTLEKVYSCLRDLTPRIEMPEDAATPRQAADRSHARAELMSSRCSSSRVVARRFTMCSEVELR